MKHRNHSFSWRRLICLSRLDLYFVRKLQLVHEYVDSLFASLWVASLCWSRVALLLKSLWQISHLNLSLLLHLSVKCFTKLFSPFGPWKTFAQLLHLNWFSPSLNVLTNPTLKVNNLWTILMCLWRESFLLKLLSHSGHWNSLGTVSCFFMCLRISPHTSQSTFGRDF